jgi:hypothetical protein
MSAPKELYVLFDGDGDGKTFSSEDAARAQANRLSVAAPAFAPFSVHRYVLAARSAGALQPEQKGEKT